jgi:hypothetical protein
MSVPDSTAAPAVITPVSNKTTSSVIPLDPQGQKVDNVAQVALSESASSEASGPLSIAVTSPNSTAAKVPIPGTSAAPPTVVSPPPTNNPPPVVTSPPPVSPPVVQAAPPAPLNPTTELARIKELADEAPTSAEPTQEILADILKTFKKLGYKDKDIKMTAQLGKEGKRFEVEPFTIDKSDKVYYRIKAKYEITAQGNGKSKETLSFERVISTDATTPEDAIAVAAHFTQTVTGLALKDAKIPGSNTLANIDAKFETKAMSNRSFSFQFARNAAGRITHLERIQVGNEKDKDKAELAVKSDSQSKFIYNFKDQNPPIKVEDERTDRDLLPGQMLFNTEEEAWLQRNGYTIKQSDNLYEELSAKKSLAEHYQTILDEIKKKEEEFAKVKATFIQEPLIKWMNKATITPETKQALADAEELAKGVSNTPREGISPNMQKFVQLKKMLDEYEEMQKGCENDLAELKEKDPANKEAEAEIKSQIKQISSAIATKYNELDQLEQAIGKDQSAFNDRLGQLHRINEDIRVRVEQLKQLRKEAEKVLGGTSADERKQEAQELVKTVSDKKLAELKGNMKQHKKAINTILDHLKNYGADASVFDPAGLTATDE